MCVNWTRSSINQVYFTDVPVTTEAVNNCRGKKEKEKVSPLNQLKSSYDILRTFSSYTM